MKHRAETRISILSLLNIMVAVAVFIVLYPVIESRAQMNPDPILSGAVVLLLAWAMVAIRPEIRSVPSGLAFSFRDSFSF